MTAHASRRVRWDLAAGPGFTPRDVPEVAAGYWWAPAAATGFGTSSFKIPEGNGNSAFDLIEPTATVANQPTLLTEHGGVQYRMRKAADAHPCKLRTANPVTAGWTGATYIGMWLRLPVDLTGINNLFGQGGFSSNARIGLLTINGTPDLLRINLVTAAQSFTNSTFPTPFADLGWHWTEGIFDPGLTLGGSDATDYAKAFSDLAQITPASKGTHPSTISNAAAEIRLSETNGDGATDTDDYDWAFAVYANGIPSRANRVKLANAYNPTGVLLT